MSFETTWQNWSLTDEHVRLEITRPEHSAALQTACADGQLWELWYTGVPRPENMDAEIERRLGLMRAQSMVPLTIMRVTEQGAVPIGMTSFMNIVCAPDYQRVEIGSTWYAKSAQRTGLNTRVKLLMLQYAFEQWPNRETAPLLAVEFRTHRLNQASRRAIERLGAQLDGILRAHQIWPQGLVRDTAVYSITADEWPVIRQHLQHLIHRGERGTHGTFGKHGNHLG